MTEQHTPYLAIPVDEFERLRTTLARLTDENERLQEIIQTSRNIETARSRQAQDDHGTKVDQDHENERLRQEAADPYVDGRFARVQAENERLVEQSRISTEAMDRARAEIERLRAELAGEHLEYNLSLTNRELRATLQHSRESTGKLLNQAAKQIRELEAENARLRLTLEHILEWAHKSNLDMSEIWPLERPLDQAHAVQDQQHHQDASD